MAILAKPLRRHEERVTGEVLDSENTPTPPRRFITYTRINLNGGYKYQETYNVKETPEEIDALWETDGRIMIVTGVSGVKFRLNKDYFVSYYLESREQ